MCFEHASDRNTAPFLALTEVCSYYLGSMLPWRFLVFLNSFLNRGTGWHVTYSVVQTCQLGTQFMGNMPSIAAGGVFENF